MLSYLLLLIALCAGLGEELHWKRNYTITHGHSQVFEVPSEKFVIKYQCYGTEPFNVLAMSTERYKTWTPGDTDDVYPEISIMGTTEATLLPVEFEPPSPPTSIVLYTLHDRSVVSVSLYTKNTDPGVWYWLEPTIIAAIIVLVLAAVVVIAVGIRVKNRRGTYDEIP